MIKKIKQPKDVSSLKHINNCCEQQFRTNVAETNDYDETILMSANRTQLQEIIIISKVYLPSYQPNKYTHTWDRNPQLGLSSSPLKAMCKV